MPRIDTPTADEKFRQGIRLQEIETTLYELSHIAGLLGDLSGQGGRGQFTDGLLLERFAVVFDWIGRQALEAHDRLSELHQELATS